MTIPEFSIVTAVTPDYLKKLSWALPTWPLKSQFKNRRLYVFHHGFSQPENDLSWIGEYFSDIRFFEFTMPEYENQRELMLSSFVLGSAKEVKEPYFCKLDADTFFTDEQDVFTEDDFNYDLFSHSWGYTKPGWWIDKLDAWVKDKPYRGDRNDKGRRSEKRIQSICCLHRTEFVRKCADACGTRLPVPSHDTYLWYMANYFSDCTWNSRKLYKHGVGHNSRFKGIRENICANRSAWNKKLNKEIFYNVQIHITNACNIGCHSCDRCCGVAADNFHMRIEQIRRFVDESIGNGYRWGRIDIIGGEPMLFPQLTELYAELQRYRDFHGGCKFRLTTNGTIDKLSEVPGWIKIRNSRKECGNRDYDFEAFNVAPIDAGYKGDDAQSCSIPWRCGIALTKYGYFLCGAGSAVARVFGLDVGAKGLHSLSTDTLRKQKSILCQYCGHSRSVCKRDKGQQTSPAWQAALEAFAKGKPELTEY